METIKKKISADICSYIDEDNGSLHLEINVPGVSKKDIKLRMLDDSFSLIAPRESFDYVTAGNFCCPVRASDTMANYENGLLKVTVPLKNPMEDAIDITIH